jgi:hypothetical protein
MHCLRRLCKQNHCNTLCCKLCCSAGFLDKGKKQAGSKSGYSNLGTGQREEGLAAAARVREQQQHPYGRSKGSAAGIPGMTPDQSAAFLHPGGGAAAGSSAAAAVQPSRKVSN